jgi:superfamily II DNA or RNA helicase
MTYTLAYNLSEYSNGLYLPSAYIVGLDAAKTLTYIKKKATEENISEFNLPLSKSIKKLLDIVVLLSAKNLEKKYNANPKKVIPLTTLLTDATFSAKISDFINRNLGEFLQIVMQEQYPICVDIENKAVANLAQLTLNPTLLQPKIYFEQTPEGLIYRLHIQENNMTWLIQKKPCLLVCNDPAWIVRDNQLSQIEGINSARLKPFFTKDEVVIPQKNLVDYCKKIILPLVEKLDFEHEGFEIIPHNTIINAELSLFHNFLNPSFGLSLRFDYGKMTFPWKDSRQQKSFLDINDKAQVIIHHVKRQLENEVIYVEKLQKIGLINQESNYFSLAEKPITSAENMINWLILHQSTLEQEGFTIAEPVLDNKPIALLRPSLNHLTTAQDNDWFDLKIEVVVGTFKIPFGQLVPNIREQNPYFLLPDSTYFIIPTEWMEKYQGIAQFGKVQNQSIKIARNQAPALLEGTFLTGIENNPKEDIKWTPPQYLKAELRPYQVKGVQWLLSHYHNNLGACLADDMGLGKTLQTIAMLLYAREHKKSDTLMSLGTQTDIFNTIEKEDIFQALQALIVLPASLVFNWESELKKFAPSIRQYIHIGPKRHKDMRLIQRFDVVLTTYQTVAKDVALLEKLEWEYIVLDESQYIKNKESDTFKAINQLKAKHKMSLSGTPIENSLADLWAQMQFINPGLLGSYAFFDRSFLKPIEKEHNEAQKEQLRKLVKPYLLRRTKEEVAKDLPPVIRQIVYSEMGDEQRKVYDKEKSAIRNLLLGVELSGKTTFEYQNIVVQSLTLLRQLAIHPQLVMPEYRGGSAKFDDALAKWYEAQSANHKMLIFSFFVKNLVLYQQHFDTQHHPYALLTGDTSLQDRKQEILDFQQDENIQTFLISLKAGGIGLNLTAADYVFLLDPWWNPAVEEQAIARAHRIGQDKTVVVLKFITKDTIEEKIMQLQERKKQLVADIIDVASQPNLTREDLAFLLG